MLQMTITATVISKNKLYIKLIPEVNEKHITIPKGSNLLVLLVEHLLDHHTGAKPETGYFL